MSTDLRAVYEELAWHLEEIRKHFRNPKVTLLVRNPGFGDASVLLGNDDFKLAIQEIEHLMATRPEDKI